ncbi:pyridoxal phosphate phosphatase PHOSPHO2 [Latimeria chalumnae]|uniref:pyridoxal phosphate phosphatase PHOSPHO2 n=1 Tax=Latimeria chalumnae TaxID=7897 RepID=UPI0006D8E7BC|nr:PREDICTED: pyridoxal phosphate phosphatase PHOSPHO2 [Latimeria chalumnae]|eukprot:XP_014344913.1 PREDICTED: pyridoxal phosphate phosphatase PHOSPHO2 [Latimeria chalumnae]
MKTLLVFDFDHTLIDDNSDTWVVKCASEEKLPDWLKNSYKKGYWTEYMGQVLHYLGDQGIQESKMRSVMATIPYTKGMSELLKFIGQNKELFDCVIISDSNTVFIDWILKAANVHDVPDKVFTNPAAFDDRGYLNVQCFHLHNCSTCPVNLCKRKVLDSFIQDQLHQGVQYKNIVYIGDGGNDLCPVKSLKKGDIVMPREGYTLERLMSRMAAQGFEPLEPSVIIWSSGEQILSHLKYL